MSVRVVYLGQLGDLATPDHAELKAPLDWTGLLAAVPDLIAEQLRSPKVRVACGGRVLANKTELMAQEGEEVALLPPVSGG